MPLRIDMSSTTIWHNPRCSKSRQTLQLIRNRGIDPVVVDYLKTPPTETELGDALAILGLRPRELMRKKESLYAELSLDRDGLDDAELIATMAKNPALIERPVVFRGSRAVIGRPPEKVLELLD